MRSFSLLLSLACIATATHLFEGQAPLGAELMTSHPGFTLDLNAQRLVQLDGEAPTWVSELDKVTHTHAKLVVIECSSLPQVRMKAKGIKFFDM
ncbi:hypothetical protein C0991_005965 [Blastosporella zonata]|nr:hypothetical protein C0991_005965 [Blastosporella zonata]